jgi:hypothetical protein
MHLRLELPTDWHATGEDAWRREGDVALIMAGRLFAAPDEPSAAHEELARAERAGVYDYATGDTAGGNEQMGDAAWNGVQAIPGVHELIDDAAPVGVGEVVTDVGMAAARFGGASNESTPLPGELPGRAVNDIAGIQPTEKTNAQKDGEWGAGIGAVLGMPFGGLAGAAAGGYLGSQVGEWIGS